MSLPQKEREGGGGLSPPSLPGSDVQCYLSNEVIFWINVQVDSFAQACLLLGTAAEVNDVAPTGPLFLILFLF